MTSPVDTFELFAELSLALAGFTGVAASFGGRDRDFRPMERRRVSGVFMFATVALAEALLVISLAHSGIQESRIYATSSAASCLLSLGLAVLLVPPVFRLYRAEDVTTSGRFIAIAITYFTTLIMFFFWAALFERESWPLVVGISAQLLWGLWLFARLLLRPN